MKNQVQVAIIGGGVVGALILCHLSKLGLAMLPKEFVLRNNGWTVELLSQSLRASLINEPLFDANGSRMRN